jgi:hypothetical protein
MSAQMLSSTFKLNHHLSNMASPVLHSSWTSVFPALNSRYHFATFCLFITSPQILTIWWWISAGASPFAFRNQITQHNSHLVGYGIDVSILNLHNTLTHCWEWFQQTQWSEWEYIRHNSIATFKAVILFPSHLCCILNFWIILMYFYRLVSHTSWG